MSRDLLPVPRRHAPGDQIGGWFRVLPGVRAVADQVVPWADHWEDHNDVALLGAPSTGWWAALGDSAAQGVGASHPRGGWAGRLDAHVRARTGPGAPVLVNLSVSGARTTDVLAEQVTRVEALTGHLGPPAFVAVAVGGNDLWRAPIPARIGANLEAIAARLPAGSLVAEIAHPRWSVLGRLVNERLREAASRHGHLVVRVNHHFRSPWPAGLATDRFHPNDRGYAAWGRAFAEAWEVRVGPITPR